MAGVQAKRIRDSRGMPEFVFHPDLGERYDAALSLKGNPMPDADWWTTSYKHTGEKYRYTVAHWAATEARFRRHFRKADANDPQAPIPLDDMLVRLTQEDVVHRRFRDPRSRAFVPDFGVVARIERGDGPPEDLLLSRQMVLFCVERRKSWRMLQSKAGIRSAENTAQQTLLQRVDNGDVPMDEFLAGPRKMMDEMLAASAR